MDYFAGLDISTVETHICVLDREDAVVYEGSRGQHDERSCFAAFRLSRRHRKHILLDQLRVRPGSDRNGIA
jgi:hypothetical protein